MKSQRLQNSSPATVRSPWMGWGVLAFLFCLGSAGLHAQTNETFATGSYIVNMGVVPQTVGNGLKPYGLVYDLVKNYNVPVRWVINPAKPKDGIDFSHNGTDYKGGPFIIPVEYRSAAVNARITYWQGLGVVGATTVSAITVPVIQTIEAAPRWTLDDQNGGIAEVFLTNAGIPNTAYDWVSPQLLGACNDLFVMPHADPEWSTHSNLLPWNLTYKGGIWAGCHAVSALENMFNPANPSQQTNFLSNKTGTAGGGGPYADPANSLVLWGDHEDGSIPYNLAYPTDQVMQFMGKTDLAHQNGSEQIFMPVLSNTWRATTKIGSWDPSQADVPGVSPGLAAVLLYGSGFGDPARGKILYEGGHSIAKATGPDNIAAQRAFFNWSYWASVDKALSVAVSGVPAVLIGGNAYPVSATVTANVPSGPYTYEWMSSCGGTFANPSAASTTFTPPVVGNNTPCVVTCKVYDVCGRTAFFSETVTVTPGPRAPIAVDDNGAIDVDCSNSGSGLTLNVLDNDSDPDLDSISVTGLSGTTGGTWSFLPNGNVTYTPAANFTGTATANYTVCDTTTPTPLCDIGSISIVVGTPDADGCYQGTASALTSFVFVPTGGTAGSSSVGNPANAELTPNYDPEDNTTYAVLNNNTDILYLDFGSVVTSGDSVRIFFASQTESSQVTIQVSYSTTAGATGPFTSLGSKTTTSNDPGDDVVYKLPIGGLRTLRIQRTTPQAAELWVDGATIETWDCASIAPVAQNDEAFTLEDIAVKISVLANDESPTGSALTVTAITSAPANGTVSINPDGTITYLNTTDVIGGGTDNFSYQTCNAEGFCASASVTVNIEEDGCPANQYRALPSVPATITINNPASNVVDTYIKADSDGNDNYGGNDKIHTGKKATNARRSLLRFDLAGIPGGSVIQSATMTLTRVGGDGNTLSLSAHRLTNAWVEGQATWTIRQTATNWSTPGGEFLASPQATITSAGSNGTRDFDLTTLVQGWFNSAYPNYGVLVKQTTEVLDKRHEFASSENGTAGSRPKLVVNYLTPTACAAIPNRAPMANPDNATTTASTAIKIGVKANDTDPDGNALTINSIVGSVTGGTATIMGDSIQFTPTNTFNGTATFLYRISDGTLFDTARVNITVNNAAPVAVNDSPAAFNSNTVNNMFAVQGNDTNPDGPNPMTTQIISGPVNGSASVSGTNILYTPTTNFYGKDTIQYRICEPVDPNACDDPLCDTAFVFIVVNNQPPVTTPDVAVTNGCQSVQIFVLNNDSDPEGQGIGLTIVNVSVPANGTAVIDPGQQSITYIPTPVASGPVTITYTVCDDAVPTSGCSTQTVTVTVNNMNPAVNNPPVAGNDLAEDITRAQMAFVPVLDNDNDPEGTPLTISLPAPNLMPPASGTVALFGSNQVKFTPAANFLGTVTFNYQICDQSPPVDVDCPPLASQCVSATVTVNVVNQPPDASDDFASTAVNVPKNIFPLANDSEPDGDDIILQAGGATTEGGTMVLNNNGTPADPTDDYYVYTPQMGFIGVDTFVYQICDDIVPPLCDNATIYITVAPPIDLQLTKTFAPMTPLSIGDPITFTLTLTNNSSTPATGVNVLDLLSGSYNYISSSGPGTYDPNFGIWAIGTVAGNATVVLTIQAEILDYAAFLNLTQVYTANQPDADSTPGNMGGAPAEDDEAQVQPVCVPPATPTAIFRQQQP
ncbi:MAG: tandem-95 repeat protein [Lewinellaceae bacterium]|nr:tandem-95 repeat protein [Lewinellaceae bacterium]